MYTSVSFHDHKNDCMANGYGSSTARKMWAGSDNLKHLPTALTAFVGATLCQTITRPIAGVQTCCWNVLHKRCSHQSAVMAAAGHNLDRPPFRAKTASIPTIPSVTIIRHPQTPPPINTVFNSDSPALFQLCLSLLQSTAVFRPCSTLLESY